MSHVRKEICANIICHLAHALVFDQPTVSRRASNDDLGPIELGQFGHLFIIDDSRLLVESVWKCLVVFRHSRNLLGRSLVAM